MLALTALALAQQGPPPQVHAIHWARPFRLSRAHPYRHSATPREIREGWLLELAVDPEAMRPRQTGVPNLWIGEHLAVRTNWDHRSGCAVVWVPGIEDPRDRPVFFGSTELPERIGSEQRDAELSRARERGLGPVPATDVASELLPARTMSELMALAADRVAACSPADADRIDALKPAARQLERR